MSRFPIRFIQTKNNAELFSKYAKFYKNPLANSSLQIFTKESMPGHWPGVHFYGGEFLKIKIRKIIDIA